MPAGIPFRLQGFIEMMDGSGRCLRKDKRGAIDSELPPIERLQIHPRHWLYLNWHLESRFKSLVGSPTLYAARVSNSASAGPMAFAIASASFPR
ncbi:hypothetical protein [Microbulbifer yueqingensis]|uniref:Uncharacterized protein n=1 Tax=Microbulbifer yueqingensis TaxID=658219 RepID=A0A1G8UF87_9GAMM|nr:hypothetical protein [Microbulbifer yueqingensis]SDJ52438.1 hypothetical protein SAMN05216212_0102 [Microbulbifer yueqingensis]